MRDRLQDGGSKSIARYDSKRLPTLGLESSKAGLSPSFGEQECLSCPCYDSRLDSWDNSKVFG